MNWLQKLGKWIGTIINPVNMSLGNALNGQIGTEAAGYSPSRTVEQAENTSFVSDGKGFWQKIWDDLMGKSQIELQNQLNRELAEEEYQRNLQSIGDTAAAYEAAGFNRNLMYNQSPAQYNAPNLTAYSGSQKIDKILQRTGQVLSMIPAMYQATAALEAIDQSRLKTKRDEIGLAAAGMSLIDKAYTIGDKAAAVPYNVSVGIRKADGSIRRELYGTRMGYGYQADPYSGEAIQKYLDSALKHKIDLLESIGIKNQMNSTLNNWRGYQYDLDRRFGAAGKVVGLGAQGLGTVAKFFSPIKFGK